MSHTLELPDELYAASLKAADASGLTPIDWIAVHMLEAHGKKGIEGEKMSHARTLADLFVGRGQYADAPMDLADASLVAVAERSRLRRLFTLDSHFHAYRIDGAASFEVVSLWKIV